MSFRKELKFSTNLKQLKDLKLRFIKNNASILYPKRKIESIYFDNKLKISFRESEEGVLPRKKVRIRNYPNTKEINLFEKKISSVEGRFKTSELIDNKKKNYLIKNGIFDKDYGVLMPIVKVAYLREYFLFNNIRLTFDTNIEYFNFQNNLKVNDDNNVLELKGNFEISDDYFNNILNLPFNRFSKYCRSIIKLNL